MSPPKPQPFKVGSWTFTLVPPGFETLEGQGVRFVQKGRTAWSAIAADDVLGQGMALETYVDTQTQLLRNQFENVQADALRPKSVNGAEQGVEITLRITVEGRRIIQRQIYARHGNKVGIITFTIDPAIAQPTPVFVQHLEESLLFGPGVGESQ